MPIGGKTCPSWILQHSLAMQRRFGRSIELSFSCSCCRGRLIRRRFVFISPCHHRGQKGHPLSRTALNLGPMPAPGYCLRARFGHHSPRRLILTSESTDCQAVDGSQRRIKSAAEWCCPTSGNLIAKLPQTGCQGHLTVPAGRMSPDVPANRVLRLVISAHWL